MPDPLPNTGDLVERYRIDGVLGEGATARVYRVTHTGLGTEHALKVLLLDRAALVDRFLQEARVQARLRHPGIVPVTDVFEHEGRPCLVMELIEGASMEAWLQARTALSADEALDLMRPVIEAVAHAHGQGVLHRDLKPDNLMLSTDQPPTARVTDFGLAKVHTEGARQGHTRAQTAMGTPGYVAPEQWADAASADERADVYSLSAILYRVIAGRPPTDPTTVEGARAMLSDDFPPLDTVAPTCPAGLADVVHQGLRADPEARLPSCAALLAALGGSQDPVPKRPSRSEETPAAPTLLPEADELAALEATVEASSARVSAASGYAASGEVASSEVAAADAAPLQVAAPSAAAPDAAAPEAAAPEAAAPEAAAPEAAASVSAAHAAAELADTGSPPRASRPLDPTPSVPPELPAPVPPPSRERLAPALGLVVFAGVAGLLVVAAVGAVALLPEAAAPSRVDIPATTFVRGDVWGIGEADERPTEAVPLEAFALDRTEVSRARWAACVQAGACTALEDEGPDDLPASGVTWDQADTFCAWAGGRLPTEWEWEAAATWGPEARQAEDKRRWPWGDAPPDCSRAHFGACGEGPVAVDALPDGASAWGALHMAGNVWEWTASTYPVRRGLFARRTTHYVLRGGAWDSAEPWLRPTFRRHTPPRDGREVHGVRCAYDR